MLLLSTVCVQSQEDRIPIPKHPAIPFDVKERVRSCSLDFESICEHLKPAFQCQFGHTLRGASFQTPLKGRRMGAQSCEEATHQLNEEGEGKTSCISGLGIGRAAWIIAQANPVYHTLF